MLGFGRDSGTVVSSVHEVQFFKLKGGTLLLHGFEDARR
jgi:hypothetical protein